MGMDISLRTPQENDLVDQIEYLLLDESDFLD